MVHFFGDGPVQFAVIFWFNGPDLKALSEAAIPGEVEGVWA